MDDVNSSLDEGYVAVGINPEYSVSFHKSTFDTAFIATTIFLGLALLAIVIVIIILSINVSKPPPIPDTVKIGQPVAISTQINYGGVPHVGYPVNKKFITPQTDGSALTDAYACAIDNNIWNDNTCTCKKGFYGSHCNLEKHDIKYFAVGTPNSDIVIPTLITVQADAKSFTANSCSKQCDADSECTGFLYDNGCKLIHGNVIVNTTIPYDPFTNTTLYMKSSENITIPNYVYVAKYMWNYPARYWLVENAENYRKLEVDKVYKLEFIPGEIIMHDDYMGIYAKHKFEAKDWSHIIQYGDRNEFYFHNDRKVLDLPLDFKYAKELYVMYK